MKSCVEKMEGWWWLIEQSLGVVYGGSKIVGIWEQASKWGIKERRER
jgi:hypothetical protein